MLQDVYIYQEISFMARGVSFIYASSEKNRMLACRFGKHCDNSRNSQSLFLVVVLKSLKNTLLKVQGIQKGILTYVRLIKYAGKDSPAKVLTQDKSTTNRFIFLS